MSTTSLETMFSSDIQSIESSEPASHAKRIMDTSEARSLLVVDQERLVGILRRNALLNVDSDALEQPVREFMTEDVPRIKLTQSPEDAHAELGGDINIEQVPVVDENGALVGVINRSDLAVASAQGESTAAAERLPVEEGMQVKDSSGSNLGSLVAADFKSDGNVEFFTVEHGLIFKKQKRLPGDVIRGVEDGDLVLNIGSTEFGMIEDLGDK